MTDEHTPDPKRVANDAIDVEIWNLRRAMVSYRDIGERLSLDHTSIRERYQRMLTSFVPIEDVEAARAEDLVLAERMIAEALQIVTGRTQVEKDDGTTVLAYTYDVKERNKASNTVLRWSQRRANIIGSDAPKRIHIEGIPMNPLAAELEVLGSLALVEDTDAA